MARVAATCRPCPCPCCWRRRAREEETGDREEDGRLHEGNQVALLPPREAQAQANADEPWRADRRRRQLHPVLLVEHVLNREEDVQIAADRPHRREIERAERRQTRLRSGSRLDVLVVVELMADEQAGQRDVHVLGV